MTIFTNYESFQQKPSTNTYVTKRWKIENALTLPRRPHFVKLEKNNLEISIFLEFSIAKKNRLFP